MRPRFWKAQEEIPEQSQSEPEIMEQQPLPEADETVYESRFRPDVLPKSKEFVKKEREFAAKLTRLAVAQILDQEFTDFEKKMLLPATEKDDPDIYEIQQRQRHQYRELCQSRFKNKPIMLETKLTMLYFGLPVDPIKFNRSHPRAATVDEGDDDSDLDDNDIGTFAVPALKFLNKYDKRTYEKDNGGFRSTPYDHYYTEYPSRPEDPALSHAKFNLRGGGGTGSGSETDEDDFTETAAPSSVSLRGGGSSPKKNSLGLTKARPVAALKHRVPLHSFSGIVQFDPTDFSTFTDAVLRLLDVWTLSNLHIDVAWYPRDLQKEPHVSKVRFGADGSEVQTSQDGKLLRTDLAEAFADGRLSGTNGLALFVCAQKTVLQESWEPFDDDRALRQSRIVKCLLTDNYDGDVAYLHIPKNGSILFNNQFDVWLRAVARILTPSRSLSHGSRPAIAPSFFGGGAKEAPDTYGGMGWGYKSWITKIVNSFELGRAPELYFTMWPTRKGLSLFMPGLARGIGKRSQGNLWVREEDLSDKDLHARIVEIIEANTPKVNLVDCKSYLMWYPGGGILDPKAKPTKYPLKMKEEELKAFLKDASMLWEDSTDPHQRWISFRPYYEKHYAESDSDSEVKFEFSDEISLSEFRKKLPQLKIDSKADFKIQPVDDVVRLMGEDYTRWGVASVAQMAVYKKITNDLLANKPYFYVPGSTTEEEWRVICNHITEPRIVVYKAEPEQEVQPVDHEIYSWGYRDPQFSDGLWWVDDSDSSVYVPPSDTLTTIPLDGRARQQQPSTSPKGPQKPLPNQQPAPKPEGNRSSTSNRLRAKPTSSSETYPPTHFLFGPKDAAHEARGSLTDIDRNCRLREFSYAHSLSFFDGSPHVPLHAPPVETWIKTPGDGGPPQMSRAIMTPTEAAKAHQLINDLHKLAADRVSKCPYKDCNKWFPVNDEERWQHHLYEAHEAQTCNFCDEPLYKHWSTAQRQNHYLTKHSEVRYTSEKSKRDLDAAELVNSRGFTEPREKNYLFCPRCGRDHSLLSNPADRNQHDNECYPEMTAQPERPGNPLHFCFCEECGDHIRVGAKVHKCKKDEDRVKARTPFCKKCGLTLGRFSSEYAQLHLLNCKGCGNTREAIVAFCSWCGISVGDVLEDPSTHIDACAKRPRGWAGSEGPINPLTGQPWPGHMGQSKRAERLLKLMRQAAPGLSTVRPPRKTWAFKPALPPTGAPTGPTTGVPAGVPAGAPAGPATGPATGPPTAVEPSKESSKTVTTTALVATVLEDPTEATARRSRAKAIKKTARTGPNPESSDADSVDDNGETKHGARRLARGPLDSTYRPKKGEGRYEDDKDKELEHSAVKSSSEEEAAVPGSGRKRPAVSAPLADASPPPKRARFATPAEEEVEKPKPARRSPAKKPALAKTPRLDPGVSRVSVEKAAVVSEEEPARGKSPAKKTKPAATPLKASGAGKFAVETPGLVRRSARNRGGDSVTGEE